MSKPAARFDELTALISRPMGGDATAQALAAPLAGSRRASRRVEARATPSRLGSRGAPNRKIPRTRLLRRLSGTRARDLAAIEPPSRPHREIKEFLIAEPERHPPQGIVDIRAARASTSHALVARDLYDVYRRTATRGREGRGPRGLHEREIGGLQGSDLRRRREGAWKRMQYEFRRPPRARVPKTRRRAYPHSSATVPCCPGRGGRRQIRPDDLRSTTMPRCAGGQHGEQRPSRRCGSRTFPRDSSRPVRKTEPGEEQGLAMRLLQRACTTRSESPARGARGPSARARSDRRPQRADPTYNWPQENRVTDHRANDELVARARAGPQARPDLLRARGARTAMTESRTWTRHRTPGPTRNGRRRQLAPALTMYAAVGSRRPRPPLVRSRATIDSSPLTADPIAGKP